MFKMKKRTKNNPKKIGISNTKKCQIKNLKKKENLYLMSSSKSLQIVKIHPRVMDEYELVEK